MKAIHFLIINTTFLLFQNCSLLFYRQAKVEPVAFDYENLARRYFQPGMENPFPLTVKRGISTHGNTTRDGRYLFYSSNSQGNYNIYFRDLLTSINVPVTLHPSEETKPAISPDGKTLVFVSEKYDTNGDLLLMEIDLPRWKEEFIRGNRIPAEGKTVNLTGDSSPRAIDTDPVWSEDSRYIAFSTDRFTLGRTNIAILDTKNPGKIVQITEKGAVSPAFSPSGDYLYFLSYEDNKQGEIYRIHLTSKKQERITYDSFKDLSPSISACGRYLIYSSIRKDTNENGRMDAGDNATVIRKDLISGESIELSPGTYSLFDTKYSSLNGGSILFTAGIDNALNVYFIPLDGIVQRQDSIRDQYKLSLKYTGTYSAYHKLANQALELFHGKDPLYPYYKAKSDLDLAKEYLREGKVSEYKSLIQSMLSMRDDGKNSLSYVYARSYEDFRNNQNPESAIQDHYNRVKRENPNEKNLLAAVQFRLGTILTNNKRYQEAKKIMENTLVNYPQFYDKQELLVALGELEILSGLGNIPQSYIEAFAHPNSNRFDNQKIAESILRQYRGIQSRRERIAEVEKTISRQSGLSKNPELFALLRYIQAEAHYQRNDFDSSIQLIQSYLDSIHKGSYVYLQSVLLQADIYRAQENIANSQKRLEYFIKNYTYSSGVDVSSEFIEDFLIFYESRARMQVLEKNYPEAIDTYNENDEILSLSLESGIPIRYLYEKYGTYFQRKYVDTVLDYSYKKNLSEEDYILLQYNLEPSLDKTTTANLSRIYGLPILGLVTKPFGDFRDLQFSEWFRSDESEKALDYYKSKLESSRKNMDLASIWGYAYLLTSKAVLWESQLIGTNSLTLSRKKKILQQLKQAEYELYWIIHADPTYVDAYMLLGYIHQYVDIRKKSSTFPEGEPEEDVYESAYRDTFPGNYLEENIELFGQLMEFLGTGSREKTQFDIHRNLANNYFLLNNYQKSRTHFLEASRLSTKIVKNVRHQNYRQEALFHFNKGRVESYTGNNIDAGKEFEKAIAIYYNNEYYPIVAEAGTKPSKESLIRLAEVKKKLALLHTLHGISLMNQGEFKEAIPSLEAGLSMNGFSEYIDDMSLYNSLAISYQRSGDTETSNEYIRMAYDDYNEKKPFLEFPNFSIWDLALPENKRIIGDGKIPGKLKPDFNHLLTRGIEIENLKIQKEFTRAEEKILERMNWIRDRRLHKTEIGALVLRNSQNDLGYNQFLRGDYMEASDRYMEYSEELFREGRSKEAFQFLKRGNIALFSQIEESRADIDILIPKIRKEIHELQELKKIRMESCRTTDLRTCSEKFREDFKQYDPILAYNYFYLGEFALHKNQLEEAFYYFGLSLGKLENPGNMNPEKIGLTNDIFTTKERTRFRISKAIIHLRIGDKKNFLKELQEAYYFALPFHHYREILTIFLLEAEYYFKYSESTKDYNRSLAKLNQAIQILENNPGLFREIDENKIGYIYQLKNYNNMALKKLDELSRDREALFSAIFFRQIATNDIPFRDKELYKLWNEIVYSMDRDQEYLEKIENHKKMGLNLQRLQESKSKNLKDLEKLIDAIRKRSGLSIHPLGWMRKVTLSNSSPNSGELVLEFYKYKNKYFVHSLQKGGSSWSSFDIPDISDSNHEQRSENSFNLERVFSDHLISISKNWSRIQDISLIPAPGMHSLDYTRFDWNRIKPTPTTTLRLIPRRGLIAEINPLPTGLRRISSLDSKKETSISPFRPQGDRIDELNFRIIRSEELGIFLPDTNVLEGGLEYSNKKFYLGERRSGFINPKDILKEQAEMPILIINNYIPSRDNYMRTSFLLDALRISGVESIILIPKSDKSELIRNDLLTNIKNLPEKIQEHGLLLLGNPIRYTTSDRGNTPEDIFRNLTRSAIQEERLGRYSESLKILLQANSYLRNEDIENQMVSEINIARLKAKLREYGSDPLIAHEKLLSKFQVGGVRRKNILYHMSLYCYSLEKPKARCESPVSEFLSNNNVTSEEKSYLEFYRNLALGNKSYVYANQDQFVKLPPHIDPYLRERELTQMYSRQFIWDRANLHAKNALNISQSSEEKLSVTEEIQKLTWERYLITGIIPSLKPIKNPITTAIQRDWKSLSEELDRVSEDDENYFRNDNRRRIFQAYEKYHSSSDFEPLNLGPIYLKDGRPSYSLLDPIERSFLFYVLTKSIPFQRGTELNSTFDILHKTELDLGNKNRALWMKIEWASYLYYNGDIQGSYRYFSEFEKDFQYSREEIVQVYNNLRFKLSKIFKDLIFDKSQMDTALRYNQGWFPHFLDADRMNDPSTYKDYVVKTILSKDRIMDEYNQRQLYDLIDFFMRKSISSSRGDIFLELGFLKNQIQSMNEKTMGRIPEMKQLPYTKIDVVKGIQNKMPRGQSFRGFMDLGIETYAFEIPSEGKVQWRLAFADNRENRYSILEYLYSLKDEGSSVAKQKTLEKKYRQALNLTPLQTTYLYMPGYHFKVTIKPRRLDRVYYVLYPERMITRDILNSSYEFPKDFSIRSFTNESRSDTIFRRKVALESMEIQYANGTNISNPVSVSQEDLQLSNGKLLTFGSNPIHSLQGIPNRKGVWILTGSELVDTSLKTDDKIHAQYYLDGIHIGKGIVNVADSKDTHVAFFLKEFLSKKGDKLLFQERYFQAFQALRKSKSEDKYWNGFRAYTNVFITEEVPR